MNRSVAARELALIDEAAALPAAERGAFLDRACAGDAALRAKLARCLADDGGGATVALLDRGARVMSAEPDELESLAAGTRLGPWEIVGLVGHGGMGEVYEARRADGTFALRVAVKLLKRGVDTQAVLRRFLAERRILAQLVHPNIAHALDAGAAPDGRPYLVMEFVRGRPLTEFLGARAATVPEMLRLMITVALAVQEAHRRWIVHRDLKPSNVLVTDEGQVKLLDFGIAKSLVDDPADATRMAGERAALTPAYAAPEQILGQPVTPAADVYALGVMLYELLTARLPHRREARAGAFPTADLLRQTTLRPSLALRQERGRIAESQRLARLRELPRDLDLIVLKALHPERERRYPMAQDFADDLQRLLDHRPVLARPDSLAYRALRFVRRNRLPVAAAAAVIVALSAGLSAALWQAGVARAQARAALLQQSRAEQVKTFMLSVFQEQDPYQRTRATQRTPLQLIAEAAKRVDAALGGDPEMHAELLVELAGIRANLGDYAGSRDMLQRALAEQKAGSGTASLPVARTLIALARGHDIEKGDQAVEIEPLVREALRILEALGQGASREAAAANLLLGRTLGVSQAKAGEALAALAQAERVGLALEGAKSQIVIDALDARVEILKIAGRVGDAEAAARDAISRIEAGAGNESLALSHPLANLGALLSDQQLRYAEAIPLFERAIAIRANELGAQAPGLADELGQLGQAYGGANRYAEARAAFARGERALPAGDDNARFYFLARRATFEFKGEYWPELERDARQVFELSRRLYGDRYPYTWLADALIGAALAAQGKFTESEAILVEAGAHMREVAGADAFDNVFPLSMLGLERSSGGRPRAALAPLREALDLTVRVSGADSSEWSVNALNLVEALLRCGDERARAEARPLLDRALTAFETSADPSYLPKALLDRGLMQIADGDRTGGRATLQRAERLFRANGGNHDIDLARIERARAQQQQVP